jgi:predicted DNA-binding transcriptional regulator YafY
VAFEVGNFVEIRYTNHRGEIAVRRILPFHIWFGKSPYHDGEQWFLDAVDLDKNQLRGFAMKDISEWRPASSGVTLTKKEIM